MSSEITITLTQLEILLDQQKELVIERLLQNSSYYNKESNSSCSKQMNIDDDKFRELGQKSNYPHDLKILRKYLK
jgi:hypothetical protein